MATINTILLLSEASFGNIILMFDSEHLQQSGEHLMIFPTGYWVVVSNISIKNYLQQSHGQE